ncbi:TetR/AcrR family transcriptional regulator [Streptomyces albireticuli]|uniref:TetR family transcriptional regulator n=1 Tax=Streptomyces albireticuli TaxID=1940 RepID=A0A2A2D876_9ACTN|nr:TetR/AcrR family transcriptional regulator [Streptomyces albireticuli]MCD9140846.1 TetR/AcrR family transcriptional regulator [Streptomyces albireticuli]MCD9161192.1 TetR/AcrR family transcriptional regulator [Streptomyces albireticuli]MCD9190750.1 TetR/AcrR family transcriptional regulator [Streptomyces albireticuli]PAU47715.1 TetR family transcriptional regulator [Streptomyces albireticuli]
MARTKEFDPDAALQSALELFWERGYEATSMADLVGHLGVARASLYATFGNKHELYLKALERYGEQSTVLEELSQPGPALPAVRALIRRFADESACDELRRGCFITNTAVELAPHDPAAGRRVERSWDGLETALTSALMRARAQGELPAGRDPAGLARMLLVLMQGMRVVGKAAPAGSARLRDAADQALSLLD